MRFESILDRAVSSRRAAAMAVLVTLASHGILLHSAAFAQTRPATPGPAAQTLLPEGFGSLWLGASQAELRRVRPAIGESAFKGDDVGYPKMLVERVNSVFIDRAIYLFDAPTPVLTGIMFIKNLPAADPTLAVHRFRGALLNKWGVPAFFGLAKGEAGEQRVALVWKRRDGVIIASYPLTSAGGTQGPLSSNAVIVRIGELGSDLDRTSDRLQAMDPAAARKLQSELLEELKSGTPTVFQ